MRTSKKAKAVKPASKPVAVTAPVAIVSNAAKPAKPNAGAARAERTAIINTARVAVAAIYNGPSLAVRSSVNPGKLARYIERLQNPGHRADTASTRDESLLARIAANADKAGSFDPCAPAINADLGVISRLGCLGFITTDGKACTITTTGAERARLVAKRA